MGSGTYPFSPPARLCELMHSYDMGQERSTHWQRKSRLHYGVNVPFDMSRLATGRSALDPLQRSCGTKVRRVAACRWVLPRSGSCEI
jgi:hypothetical protein